MRNVAIILTSHCNSKRMKDIYKLRVMYWLKYTPFKIYFVDSANYGMDDPKILNHINFSQFIFDQYEHKHLINIHSKPHHKPSSFEAYSIKKIINNFKLNEKYKILYKITGKYFIKNWQSLVNFLPRSDKNLIVQFRRDTHNQNCEIFGGSPNIILEILEKQKLNNISLEDAIDLKKITYRLPPLNLLLTYKRSIGDILYYL